jgi:hypothetical protein
VIARELAERNRGALTLAPAARGTAFVPKLLVFLSVLEREEPQHMGRRAMAL